MADSLSFGGVDLSGSNYGVTLMESPLSVLAAPRLSKSSRIGNHGAVVRGSYIEERTLTLPVVVQGTDFSDLLAKCNRLRSLFAPGTDKALILDYQNDRSLNCRLSKMAEGKVYGTRAVELTLEFLAGDPLWYGTTLHSRTISGQNTFNDWRTSLGGTPYGGSADTPISFLGLQGDENSDSSYLYVENTLETHTTIENRWGSVQGADNWVPYRIGPNLYVRFNSDLETISVSPDLIAWTSIMDYRSVSYTSGGTSYVLPTQALLHPGENSFTCAGLSGAYTWTYSYYDRWL